MACCKAKRLPGGAYEEGLVDYGAYCTDGAAVKDVVIMVRRYRRSRAKGLTSYSLTTARRANVKDMDGCGFRLYLLHNMHVWLEKAIVG